MPRACLLVVALLAASCADGSDVDTVTASTTEPATAVTTTAVAPPVDQRAGSIDESTLGPPYLGPLVVDLPDDCSVPVVEEVVKRGETVTLEYRLAFNPLPEGTSVEYLDMRITAVGGVPVPVFRQTEAAASFRLPSFLVAESGQVVAVTGIEDLIDDIAAFDPEAAEAMSNPAIVSSIESVVRSKYWGAWVGSWAEWGSFERPIEVLPDSGGGFEITFESVGTTDDGLAVLRQSSEQSGPGLVDSIRSSFANLVPPGASTQEMEAALTTADGTLEDVIEVVTDPQTLRPQSTFVGREIELTIEGETRLIVETRVTVFDWTSSTCR